MMLHSFAWNKYIFAQDKHQESQNPVIGVILPFSSTFKGIAVEQQKAVNIALDKYHQGYDVIFKDGGADKESAVKAFNELAMSDDRPLAVISCSSLASDAIHPLAAEKVIFHIAIGSNVLDRQVQDSTVQFGLLLTLPGNSSSCQNALLHLSASPSWAWTMTWKTAGWKC